MLIFYRKIITERRKSLKMVLDCYQVLQCEISWYNEIYVKLVMPGALFSCLVVATVALYVSITMYSTLPLMMYSLFPYIFVVGNIGVSVIFRKATILFSTSQDIM